LKLYPEEAFVTLLDRLLVLLLLCSALGFVPSVTDAQTDDSSPSLLRITDTNGNGSSSGEAQATSQNPSPKPVICGINHVGQCLKDLGNDQVGIWTSPLRIRGEDAYWLVPFAAATGVALHYDAQAIQGLGVDKTREDASSTFSDVGLYGSIAGAGGLYVLGLAKHNDHLAETGRLGEEAMLNSLLVVEALKLATNRERPNEGNGHGGFWPHGTRSYETDGSFPSGHAAATFAFARVLASEYPSKKVQLAAYAFALAVSASRVTAREHFPSDVLVGGTFGYLIGGYVVRHHAAKSIDSGFAFMPVMDVATHTFGGRIELRPDQLDLAKVGRFVKRMSPN
jgi:membrane-associated phospholipid phosphatase